ncbi:transposase [Hymenobacter setariae]|uniref:transposase n=1 Tax=Hymenobacter setariae TaxID=2594794 RepID=UPI001F32107B|nr:transposase [Hymenobacter setariae]
MSNLIQYERRLPHRLPPGEAIFLTFRLADTLPRQVVAQLHEEAALLTNRADITPEQLYAERKRYFGRFDRTLDSADFGPTWLRQPDIAALVVQSLHYFDGGRGYDLLSYCLMPNHLHMVVLLLPEAPPLIKTLQRLKSYTATQANKLLGRTGAFWQAESYDHVVRNGELERIISYVLENPVKAGLVDNWEQWPYSYMK